MKERDPERYNQFNIYDVIPIPTKVHSWFHSLQGTSWKGCHHTEEAKKKMSDAHIDRVYPTGWHHSKETKRKMSEAKLGKEPWNKGNKTHWWHTVDGRTTQSQTQPSPEWMPGRGTRGY